MLQITINVNTHPGNAHAVKETLAMYLERWGDSKVVSVKEFTPQAYRQQQPAPQAVPQPQQPEHQQQRFY